MRYGKIRIDRYKRYCRGSQFHFINIPFGFFVLIYYNRCEPCRQCLWENNCRREGEEQHTFLIGKLNN